MVRVQAGWGTITLGHHMQQYSVFCRMWAPLACITIKSTGKTCRWTGCVCVCGEVGTHTSPSPNQYSWVHQVWADEALVWEGIAWCLLRLCGSLTAQSAPMETALGSRAAGLSQQAGSLSYLDQNMKSPQMFYMMMKRGLQEEFQISQSTCSLETWLMKTDKDYCTYEHHLTQTIYHYCLAKTKNKLDDVCA